MRVVSLVPSWTETLLESGVNVVGRTRFCLHPKKLVTNIPAIGGTKDVNWGEVEKLKPDIIIFDKEENTKELYEECSWESCVTHVEKVRDVSVELEKLSKYLKNKKLFEMSLQWAELLNRSREKKAGSLSNIPGVLNWWKELDKNEEKIKNIVYLIWKDPWMTISQNTFIGSVLDELGYGKLLDWTKTNNKKYPEIDLSQFSSEDTLLLFSSEPYPFAKKEKDLKSWQHSKALIDGELFSWFGVRAYRFLYRELR